MYCMLCFTFLASNAQAKNRHYIIEVTFPESSPRADEDVTQHGLSLLNWWIISFITYLYLGAVVGVLCRQQAREALGLLLHRILVLLLTGSVTVHVTRFWGKPSPPPVTV